MRSPPWYPNAAVIVAESLRRIPLPLPGSAPASLVPPRSVAAALARSLAPPTAPDAAPQWLRPGQVGSFRRVVAALRRHGGVLLAEPVGTGKTFVALAAARILGGSVTVIVPAAVLGQWEHALARCGVVARLTTHEQWSRAPRPVPPGLVIIDEAHRFRNPGIRRYRHLAPALVGRQVVLLTATPVVNRAEDLAHLLLLGLRDDVLTPFGTPSLSAGVQTGTAPGVLGHVVVCDADEDGVPVRQVRTVLAPGDRALMGALRRLDGLELSHAPAVRTLLRTVLIAALASSRAAFREALGRYRLLLLQAEDAARVGRPLSRGALRRVLAGELAQTVLWDLLDGGEGESDLTTTDLPRLDSAILATRVQETDIDPKVELLRDLVADGAPTVVFTSSRATVAYLRDRLRPRSAIAWCTGGAAGIGPARLPRPQVLAWFRPGRADPHALGPRILVTTDVAAEGLDLQRAARIVHYDLPWTAVRLEQRTGRAARLGSTHAAVEVIEIRPPPALERRLGINAAIVRKAAHATRLGVGAPDASWRWRRAIATRLGIEPGAPGLASVTADAPGIVAGVELWRGMDRLGAVVLARASSGPWTDRPAVVGAALQTAWDSEPDEDVVADLLRRDVARFIRRVEADLRVVDAAARLPGDVAAWLAGIIRRIRLRGQEAVRHRDRATIAAADRALAALRRGWTAGERMVIGRLAEGGADELIHGLAALPGTPQDQEPVRIRFVGLVRFGPGRNRCARHGRSLG